MYLLSACLQSRSAQTKAKKECLLVNDFWFTGQGFYKEDTAGHSCWGDAKAAATAGCRAEQCPRDLQG